MAQILVIDDDTAIRTMVRMALEHAGHTVTEAPDGRAGLQLLSERMPELVITDLIMPEKEGLEVMMEARKTHPSLRFIAMSGAGRRGSDYLRVAKYLGAKCILAKPFTPEQLMAEVNRLLASGGAPTAP